MPATFSSPIAPSSTDVAIGLEFASGPWGLPPQQS